MRIFPATLRRARWARRLRTAIRTRDRPLHHPRPHSSATSPRARWSPGAETGDTLIEVLISCVLVAGIVVATLTGLDSTNRATALDRARSEADTLAQQAQDRLRAEPILKLSEIELTPRTETVQQNGTTFTITSSALYRADATATASCSAITASADYIETSSKVTWPSLGVGKPVVETGMISPPPGTTLMVQVVDAAEPIAGMNVVATGPAPETAEHKAETSANGCAILALNPGEYTINVSKAGYVTPNGYENSKEDVVDKPSSTKFLVAETSNSLSVEFAPAGALEVKFTGSTPAEGDTFVAANAGMNTPRPFGTLGTYKTAITAPKIFPFPATKKYGVYAGTCVSDAPESVGSVKAVEAEVMPSLTKVVTVTQPPLYIRVMSGKSKASAGSAVTGATVHLKDTGCTTVREFKTTTTGTTGTLPYPGVPFGTYELCVTGGTTGLAKNRKYITPVFKNNTATGPSELAKITNDKEELVSGYAVIYMESGAPTTPGKLESNGNACPF